MLLQLIDDVDKALDAESYFSALSLVLTFPDICGKAEYPGERSTAKRYIDWYDNHVGKYEQYPCEQCQTIPMPYLSGEVVYSLRNSLLHQGTPNIDTSRIKEERNKIDCFELITEAKNAYNIYCDAAGIYNGSSKTYRVNIRRLCLILCACARAYFKDNQDKFDFFHFSIIDRDAEVNKINNITD